MNDTNSQMKKMFTLAIVMFIISIIGIIFTYKYIGLSLLGLTGCAIGFFLGTYTKYIKKIIIPKTSLLILFIIAFFVIGLSILFFNLFSEGSYVYILLLNSIAICGCIFYIMKKAG